MVFFVVFANAFQGVREADRNMIANAGILGASDWQVIRTVVIPPAVNWIFARRLDFEPHLIGKRTVTMSPPPSASPRRTLPPAPSTTSRTIERPRPLPSSSVPTMR